MLRSSLIAIMLTASSAASAAEPVSGLVKLPSGVSLHYVVQGRAEGEPVVLLHGVGDSWHSYELVLPLLPDRYRVYAVSMRGHGLSDAPETGYAQKDFAADVTAFMEALNLRGVTLVGHSLGSFVAQVVAAQDAGRVKRLVLVGSGPGGVMDPAVAREVRAAFEAIAADPKIARDFQASTVHRPVPARFFETMVQAMSGVPAHMWKQVGVVVQDEQTVSGLASIKVPTLLIWGDRDALLGRKDQDALLARIRGARLVVYPEIGHTPHWEDPAHFASDLLSFMGAAGTP